MNNHLHIMEDYKPLGIYPFRKTRDKEIETDAIPKEHVQKSLENIMKVDRNNHDEKRPWLVASCRLLE